MKKSILIIFYIIGLIPFLISQQIQNAGFEDWEDAGTVIEEPVEWSTVKTSDNPTISTFAPVTWEQSDDAHSGNYSLKLFNFYSAAAGLVVAGTMTNGMVHGDFNADSGYVFTNPDDEKWNTAFPYRPDSIAFWMKFFPQGNDTMQFQALLHVGEGTLPPKPNNEDNKVAYTRADIPNVHANWTRYALAFNYYNEQTPDYILLVLTSGNGTNPVEDSYVLFDDLEIISTGVSIKDNIPDENLIYVANNTLYLNNIPQNIIQDCGIEIIDLTGRVLYQNHFISSEISLDLENINSGFYIVRLVSSTGTISKKFFIR